MKYKTSFFNKGIILEDFKRLWGLSVLYFLGLFLAGPLSIMLRMGDPNRDINYIVEGFLSLRYSGGIQAVYVVSFAVLLAVIIYRYLHTINSTTVIHSYPLTRNELFHSHNLSAALLIAIPVLINTLLLLVIMFVGNDGSELFEKIFTFQGVMIWTGKILLVNISVYLIATLAAMVTGTSIVQAVLSFIFMFLPIGLGSLILVNLDQLLYGFTMINQEVEMFLLKIIPTPLIWGLEQIAISQLVWYLVLALVLYTLALIFYKRRNLERATDPISLDGLKPIFKYGVTFCSMVVGGVYFDSIISTDKWLYIGYFVGAIIGYIIAEMLLKKTIWVFKNFKGFVLYSLIVILVFVGIKLDITGFEKRVPELDSIQNVYYGNLYSYQNDGYKGLEKEENIELVRQLHAEMIENKGEFKNIADDTYQESVGISYELKNGRKLFREYQVPAEFVKNNSNIKQIFETMEYKRNNNNIFKVEARNVDYIQIDPSYPYGQSKILKIIDQEEIDEFLQVIKMDIYDETFAEYNSGILPWANVILSAKDGKNIFDNSNSEAFNPQIDIAWKKHYSAVDEWLKEKGYYDQARVMPEDIKHLLVAKIGKNMMDKGDFYEEIDKIPEKSKVEIKDKETIEYLLNYQEEGYYSYNLDTFYYLGAYFKDGNYMHGVISEENLPKEIKDLLK